MSIPFRIGDSVDVVIDGAVRTATVKAYRISKDRQIMTAIDDMGQPTTIVVALRPNDAADAKILVPPADIASARTVAMAVLAGQSSRLPIAAEANLLAAAVVALTGGAA